jgi:hypothetical protein
MTKYQNYKHYKLPITINPLEYGKLIFKLDNIFIIYVTSFTIAVITKFDEFNEVKFFRKGDLDFIYKDHIIDENTFVRSLDSRKFTFKNNQLINTIKTIIQPIIMAIITILNSTTLLINLYKMKNIIKFFDNIYKNYKVELFILFEFFIILLV